MGWGSLGDFFQSHLSYADRSAIDSGSIMLTNQIRFRNLSRFSKIISISISAYSDKSVTISLQPSSLFVQEIFSLAQKCCLQKKPVLNRPKDSTRISQILEIEMEFTKERISEFFKLLTAINAAFNQDENEISNDLIKQLKEIFDFFYYNKKPSSQQIIAAVTPYSAHINPERKNSKALIKLFNDHRYGYGCRKKDEPVGEKEMVNILSEGENPNAEGSLGETVYWFLIRFYRHKNLFILLKLLSYYGGDPFLPGLDLFNSRSAFEMAYQYNQEVYQLFYNLATRLEKTPAEKSKSVTIIDAEVSKEGLGIKTVFRLDNGEIITSLLKDINLLSPAQIQTLFRKYKEFFEVPGDINGTKLEEFFQSELRSPRKKFVDLLFNRAGELIGFILFSLIKLEKNENYLIVYCEDAVLDKRYRKDQGMPKLMKYLTSRPANALELLFPEYVIGFFGYMITAASFCIFVKENQKLVQYPMYQSKKVDPIISEITGSTVAPGQFHHNGTESYITTCVQVKPKQKSEKTNSIGEYFYLHHVLNIDEQLEGEIRDATVLYLSPEFPGLGINHGNVDKLFTRLFYPMVEGLVKPNSKYVMKKATPEQRFWQPDEREERTCSNPYIMEARL